MRILSQQALKSFWERHPDSAKPLRDWFKTAQASVWRNLIDVRRVYPHADAVETRHSGILTVFKVCGNKYRLVVRIRYDWALINIRSVFTHAEYSKEKWKV